MILVNLQGDWMDIPLDHNCTIQQKVLLINEKGQEKSLKLYLMSLIYIMLF